ncbi:PH domain-containing protein [Haloarcula sp. S1CR25-12]|uniref:PH domain-containing protein n=1 Tax=Haloarcula saliterrae TaxID=2950534 RepID=A0ABU2FAI7_9EURY|nr:PH domain-containing protein [Haloarcula sp. S1CR25-12]MDS0258933.1 PH domain-containing protein [Haloarcula sp. S1CR25-12]
MTTQVHRLTDASEDEEPADASGDELLRVTPSTKPVLVRLVVIVVAGLAAIGVFLRRPELLGDREVTNIALLATQLLVGIGVVRQLSQYVVLRHTEYVVTPTVVTTTYELLGRSKARQVPFERVRSHELNQSRVENALDHGTIMLNQGLGDLRLRNVREPFDVYDVIKEQAQT